jgi:L-lactate dehydrogenase complex protein LldF
MRSDFEQLRTACEGIRNRTLADLDVWLDILRGAGHGERCRGAVGARWRGNRRLVVDIARRTA